jgi:hypothetical protein
LGSLEGGDCRGFHLCQIRSRLGGNVWRAASQDHHEQNEYNYFFHDLHLLEARKEDSSRTGFALIMTRLTGMRNMRILSVL